MKFFATFTFVLMFLKCFCQETLKQETLIARMDLYLNDKTGETSIVYRGKAPSYFAKMQIDSIYGTQVDSITLKECEKINSFIRNISVKNLKKGNNNLISPLKLEDF